MHAFIVYAFDCCIFCPNQGSFGSGCNSICRCENGGTCHHVDGTCSCPAGVEGQFCEIGCPAGFYGDACDERCPDLLQCPSGRCDRELGICACAAGFYGTMCHLACPPNTYGPGCSKMCACSGRFTDGCDPSVSRITRQIGGDQQHTQLSYGMTCLYIYNVMLFQIIQRHPHCLPYYTFKCLRR